jgi:hypothetical protein
MTAKPVAVGIIYLMASLAPSLKAGSLLNHRQALPPVYDNRVLSGFGTKWCFQTITVNAGTALQVKLLLIHASGIIAFL